MLTYKASDSVYEHALWILKLSYNFWFRCSIMFSKSYKKCDKAMKTVIIHSKTDLCIKFESIQPFKVELVAKKRQKIVLS